MKIHIAGYDAADAVLAVHGLRNTRGCVQTRKNS
jgi:hypothetical protein